MSEPETDQRMVYGWASVYPGKLQKTENKHVKPSLFPLTLRRTLVSIACQNDFECGECRIIYFATERFTGKQWIEAAPEIWTGG